MMHIKSRSMRSICLAVGAMALSAFVLVPSASAHTGEFARFNYCPSTNPAVVRCIQSTTTGGEVILGKKKVPIVNPVTLQGGFGVENQETALSNFYGATNGVTLSKSPQPVPGGLSGLVNCKEISLSWLRSSCEAIFENGLTGVNSTVELARPATEIRISEFHLLFEEGLGLKLPVKVHLENPLLGSSCYIGSSSSPIIWNLTTGKTAPPPPNQPISGFGGNGEFVENEEILKLNGTKLVDNAWSAPGAEGCGGWPAEYILDPIINASVGVPSAAGKNTAIEVTNAWVTSAEAVNEH